MNNLVQESALLFLKEGYASTSLLCRRLNIDYNKSIEIINILEKKEIIGAFSGTKLRELLVKTKKEIIEKLNEKKK